MSNEIKPLSQAISDPLIKTYKAGGLVLSIAFIGTFLLLAPMFLGKSIHGYIAGSLGGLMLFAVLFFFYFHDIKKLKDVHDKIKDNKELIDTVQESAIRMTDLSYELQALAFKHADEIASLIALLRNNVRELRALPLISSIPGIDKVSELSENQYVIKAEDLSTAIVETTLKTKTIIKDIKKSLIESDAAPLKKYLKQLDMIEEKLQDLLKK